MVEYFRSPRIVRRFFTYIYPLNYSVAIILHTLYGFGYGFSNWISITRISYKIPINLSRVTYFSSCEFVKF